jgi:hypothetical protein
VREARLKPMGAQPRIEVREEACSLIRYAADGIALAGKRYELVTEPVE